MASNYWRAREEAQRAKNITDEAVINAKMQKIYDRMRANIATEIDSFYEKYALSEGISIAEAKKRVSKLDIKAYEAKAKQYVKMAELRRAAGEPAGAEFSETANREMALYNATMRINRLEMLKSKIGLELADGYDELESEGKAHMTKKAQAELERQAGILRSTVKSDVSDAKRIVNASFYNATFSDRIWGHEYALKLEIEKALSQYLISGKGSRELSRELTKKFSVSAKDAQRLMATEVRRVQTDVAKESYEKNGNKRYEFLALNPKGPCPICKALDGSFFAVSAMMPGENAPPMHPSCHCATAPAVE